MSMEGFLLCLPRGVMPTPTMRATLGPLILSAAGEIAKNTKNEKRENNSLE